MLKAARCMLAMRVAWCMLHGMLSDVHRTLHAGAASVELRQRWTSSVVHVCCEASVVCCAVYGCVTHQPEAALVGFRFEHSAVL
jgi:hypothetical protein